MKFFESDETKVVSSEDYNYVFSKKTGQFARWGKTKEDDPEYSPYGPEILDLEISDGNCKFSCPFCYKGNAYGKPGYHMSLSQFKTVLSKFPKTLTQIAFGITSMNANPHFFEIMEHSRVMGVIPNFTMKGLEVIDTETAERIASLCGAVAVSIDMAHKDIGYNLIQKLTDAGMTQVNIHQVLSMESIDQAKEIVDDIKSDYRLAKMNAIVFLQFKNKRSGSSYGKDKYHSISSVEVYADLINYCESKNVNFGFDSCSAPLFMKSCKNPKQIQFAEPCESGLFSSYVNCHGDFFPCSFSEGEGDWKEGLSVLNCDDFMKDIWNHPRVVEWRSVLISSSKKCECIFANSCRSCPIYPEINSCKK
jgi:hypothetical protein